MTSLSPNQDRPSSVALITGASSGIGAEVAQTLTNKGYRVALCARRRDRLELLKEKLTAAGVEVLIQATDLRQESDILSLFERVRQQWGGVDVLINNAGLGHKAPLMSGETEAWREMLDVNILALCVCTREAVKDMQRRGDRGHIIHISSLSGHRVPGASGVYAATKYAVRALTEALRQELRMADSQIRISSISPGFTETEFAEKYHGDASIAEEIYSRFPVLQSKDIANAVAYVLEQPEYVQVHDILLRSTFQST
ncbi:SDR family NAD(P)-dependent oxidoreductase [Oscillatoria sp. CS-180]|uniref:SDR family NAD(P)-dependent oxidoreductase n=1 Tax=Oscillatoria sp. CS-180 TaxID=3021720 RepID=UPI00232D0CB8|nr:SDR family NAD(P)-dependent oxidoreductase [Oscillatoria sp. CS-180]MDB9527701.1 SDR family NAD(P)-dependent oxidoreductase [Oscillatoria sp. CS-180]